MNRVPNRVPNYDDSTVTQRNSAHPFTLSEPDRDRSREPAKPFTPVRFR